MLPGTLGERRGYGWKQHGRPYIAVQRFGEEGYEISGVGASK